MSLLDDVSIVVTPNGYKAGELYAVVPVPTEGSELVTNGDFANWTGDNPDNFQVLNENAANYVTESINQLRMVSDNSATIAIRPQPTSMLTVGKIYKVSVDLTFTTGSIDISGNSFNTSGTKVFYINAGATYLQIAKTSALDVLIDNVSVKEYTSADMDVTRETAATRVDENGLVNYAEIIGDSVLTGNNSNFETGIGSWVTYIGGSLAHDTDKLEVTLLATGSGARINTNSLISGGQAGKTFKVRAKIWQGTTTATQLNVYLGGVQDVITVSSTPTYFEIELTPINTGFLTIYRGSSSGGTFFIDDVTVKEAARDNVPRIDYTGGGCPHILAEPQRTNVVASSDPTSNEGAAGNIAYEPFSWGLGTLIENSVYYADNTVTRFRRLGGSLDASTSYAFSFYCIKDDKSAPTFALGVDDDFIVKLNGLQISQSLDEVVIKDKGSGVYLITIVSNRGTGSINVIEKTASSTSIGFRVSGFQIEEGTYPTSLIPTSGSTVTRNQDIFTRDGIGSLINSTEGTLVIEPRYFINDGSGTGRKISISDGTSSNRIYITPYQSLASRIRCIFTSGGSTQADLQVTGIDITVSRKLAFVWATNRFELWQNGVKISEDTSGSTPSAGTFNQINFSSETGNGSEPFEGELKQLQVYKTALTDVQLAALTS